MSAIVRDLLPFPPGDNISDTFISGTHWNLTTLHHWNYTYYSNETFSNGSRCYLVFEPYIPVLLQNGSFVNSTTCYSPILPIGSRGSIGLFFASLFFLSVGLTVANLGKHAKLSLPAEKRFLPAGRKWQWCWMLVVAAFALISSIFSVDIDRYYLPALPLIVSSIFWVLMLPTTLAIVLESVRHWGSWQERQLVDLDPFQLSQDDRRSRVELWIPFAFYVCFLMNIFMAVLRPWTNFQNQRSPEQIQRYAEPSATDVRFKIAAVSNVLAWLTIVFSLGHSVKHYNPRRRGLHNGVVGLIEFIPIKFLITIPLSLLFVIYEFACSYDFHISPLKLHTDLAYMYGLGWAPIACIVLVYEIAGYIDPNEDEELKRQRRIRNVEVNSERSSPLLHGHNPRVRVLNQIAENVSESGGLPPPYQNNDTSIEMRNLRVSRTQEQDRPVSGDRERDTSRARRTTAGERSDSTNSRESRTAQPPRIRSMLDV